MFVCGSGSFSNDEEDKNGSYNSPCQTPKRSKNNTGLRRFIGRDNKSSTNNPYADNGLDKFYQLLAEHEGKKQKIYTEIGSDDISFIRFNYAKDSQQVKPIVIRVKDKNKNKQEKCDNKKPCLVPKSNEVAPKLERKEELGELQSGAKKRHRDGRFRLQKLTRPGYYFCTMMVMIMVFLCVSGRSFAILCTSIGWYLNPSITNGSSSSSSSTRKPKRKKEYVKFPKEEKFVHCDGPKKVITN